MRHLNYSHLLYFWTVAREGSIIKASQSLNLAPQTISSQLKLLEDAVGEPLFQRVGRGLVLSETGVLVKRYADEIFALGTELAQWVRSKQPGSTAAFHVGVVNSIPKLIAHRVLQPALELEDQPRMSCWEGDLESLLSDLAMHRLDLVVSDRPIPIGLNVKAYNHDLGGSAIGFFAHRSIKIGRGREFPDTLRDLPMLLPVGSSPLRRSLDDWFEQQEINPLVVAEFDDSALLKAFGHAAAGIFPAPAAIEREVCTMYETRFLGAIESVTEHYYAISPERKIKHPATQVIIKAARTRLFKSS